MLWKYVGCSVRCPRNGLSISVCLLPLRPVHHPTAGDVSWCFESEPPFSLFLVLVLVLTVTLDCVPVLYVSFCVSSIFCICCMHACVCVFEINLNTSANRLQMETTKLQTHVAFVFMKLYITLSFWCRYYKWRFGIVWHMYRIGILDSFLCIRKHASHDWFFPYSLLDFSILKDIL